MGGKLGGQLILLQIYRSAYRSSLFPPPLFFFFVFVFLILPIIAVSLDSFGRLIDDVFIKLA